MLFVLLLKEKTKSDTKLIDNFNEISANTDLDRIQDIHRYKRKLKLS